MSHQFPDWLNAKVCTFAQWM